MPSPIPSDLVTLLQKVRDLVKELREKHSKEFVDLVTDVALDGLPYKTFEEVIEAGIQQGTRWKEYRLLIQCTNYLTRGLRPVGDLGDTWDVLVGPRYMVNILNRPYKGPRRPTTQPSSGESSHSLFSTSKSAPIKQQAMSLLTTLENLEPATPRGLQSFQPSTPWGPTLIGCGKKTTF
jgi:hypothetical protein